MFKWLLVCVIVSLVLVRTPLARKLRLGDLPGDLRFNSKRFAWLKLHLPFTSTLLICVVVFVGSRLIH